MDGSLSIDPDLRKTRGQTPVGHRASFRLLGDFVALVLMIAAAFIVLDYAGIRLSVEISPAASGP